jgi:hypothetical protein
MFRLHWWVLYLRLISGFTYFGCSPYQPWWFWNALWGWPHRLIHFFWIIRAGVVPESLAPNGSFQQKHLVSTFKSAAQTWGVEHWDAKYHVAKGILRKMEDEKGLVWGLWINVVNRLYNKPTMWEWFIQPIHGNFWWFWGWFIIGFTTF